MTLTFEIITCSNWCPWIGVNGRYYCVCHLNGELVPCDCSLQLVIRLIRSRKERWTKFCNAAGRST